MKFTAITLAASAALLSAAVANAESYTFTYTGSTVQATGVLEVFEGVATAGSITVSGIEGMEGTFSLMAGNGYSPSNAFFFDNQVSEEGQHLTGGGLLFMRGAQEINVWGNSATSYSLYGWNAGYNPQDNDGTFIMNTVPGPGAMALLGAAGLVASRRRRA
ncbi:MAG: hypothetical protein U0636_11850 [Phycisphaerales bacterium]